VPQRVEPLAVLLGKQVGEAVDAAQGRAQVVRDGVGEGLQFAVGNGEFGGALADAVLQLGVEFAHLVLGTLLVGDVAHQRIGAAHRAVGAAIRHRFDLDDAVLAIPGPARCAVGNLFALERPAQHRFGAAKGFLADDVANGAPDYIVPFHFEEFPIAAVGIAVHEVAIVVGDHRRHVLRHQAQMRLALG